MREALEYCRNVLWWILVQHAKGSIALTSDQRAVVDQAHQVADEALKEKPDHEDT
jgi:hypothetical protein